MTLDDMAKLRAWRDESTGDTVVIASNGYTRARAVFYSEAELDLSLEDIHRCKVDAARSLLNDLHWRTPLAHAHRRTDGA